jgi:hypothetical protein
MPQVLRLFRAPKRGLPMEELPQVAALQEVGFEDCAHAQLGGKRQVLLVDRETLDALSRNDPGEHHHGRAQRQRSQAGRIPQSRRGAARSDHGLYALRSDRRFAAGPAERNPGQARDALSHYQRRNHPPGRRYRKADLNFNRDLWLGLAVQRRRIRRLVFVFFGLLHWFLWWNDPIKAALGHRTEDETGLF